MQFFWGKNFQLKIEVKIGSFSLLRLRSTSLLFASCFALTACNPAFDSIFELQRNQDDASANNSVLPRVSVSNKTVLEDENSFRFEVELDRISDQDTHLSFSTLDESAFENIDYNRSVGNLTIPAGSTRASFSVDRIKNISQVEDLRLKGKVDCISGCRNDSAEGYATIDYNGVPEPALTTTLFENNFENSPLGLYQVATLNTEWNSPTAQRGIDTQRVTIVDGAEAFANGRSMRVFFQKDTFGINDSGAQWRMALPASYDETYATFRVKFSANFNFVKGGKLPGFTGGAGNTGGNKPNGLDGWSARLLWKDLGTVFQYIYHVDQPDNFGQRFAMDDCATSNVCKYELNKWFQVTTRVVMNVPGQNNGIIQSWIDGKLRINKRDLRFRDVDTFGIDTFYFNTFFGGGDQTFASADDVYIYFDDFKVYLPE